MIRKVITGGQTGADQAGWRAAREMGIPTGGYMPKGWITEDGPNEPLGLIYDAQESETADYPTRTELNVKESDVVLWFGHLNSPGAMLTKRQAGYKGIPFLPLPSEMTAERAATVARQIRAILVGTNRHVMIAGNRESSSKGIGRKTEMVCLDIFRAYNALEKRR